MTSAGGGVKMCVLPAGVRPFLVDAARAGGAEVVERIEEAEGLVWASSDGAADLRAVLDAHPNIRWVQLPWAGIEPFVAALDHERLWTAGQDVYSEPVAEHALALLLAGLRNLKRRAAAATWERATLDGGAREGLSLFHARVCVVGAGGITRALLPLLAPFHVRVTLVRRRAGEAAGLGGIVERTVGFADRARAMADADAVVLACALTPETRGMIGAAELAAMKPDAWIVNVARGALIDTAALIHALERGAIGGAALDVTDPEPLPDDHPLWRSPRCLITPHVANTPAMAVPLLTARVRDNVRRYRAKEPMLGVIDVDAGY